MLASIWAVAQGYETAVPIHRSTARVTLRKGNLSFSFVATALQRTAEQYGLPQVYYRQVKRTTNTQLHFEHSCLMPTANLSRHICYEVTKWKHATYMHNLLQTLYIPYRTKLSEMPTGSVLSLAPPIYICLGIFTFNKKVKLKVKLSLCLT
jgi:hypothetical protein